MFETNKKLTESQTFYFKLFTAVDQKGNQKENY